MKRIWIWAVVALVIVLVIAVIADPTQIVLGTLLGEPFFESRPTRYWAQALQAEPGLQADARGRLEKGGSAAVPVLTGMLIDFRTPAAAELRCAAVEILAKIGPDAVNSGPELVETMRDSDPHVQAVCIAALPKVGVSPDIAVPALSDLLRSDNNVVAARALSQYKGEAVRALPNLVALLRDTSQNVEARWNAARTIGKIGPEANSVVETLIEMTRDKEPTIREHSAEAIGDIGSVVGPEAIQALIKSMSDPIPRVRRDAVRSLGYIGPKAREAVPEIKSLLKDPEEIVRTAAGNALKAIAPDEVESPEK
jgi:HEAT repeat protein